MREENLRRPVGYRRKATFSGMRFFKGGILMGLCAVLCWVTEADFTRYHEVLPVVADMDCMLEFDEEAEYGTSSFVRMLERPEWMRLPSHGALADDDGEWDSEESGHYLHVDNNDGEFDTVSIRLSLHFQLFQVTDRLPFLTFPEVFRSTVYPPPQVA